MDQNGSDTRCYDASSDYYDSRWIVANIWYNSISSNKQSSYAYYKTQVSAAAGFVHNPKDDPHEGVGRRYVATVLAFTLSSQARGISCWAGLTSRA